MTKTVSHMRRSDATQWATITDRTGKTRPQMNLVAPNIEFSCRPDSDRYALFPQTASSLNKPHPGGQLQRFDNITAPPCALLSEVGLCAPRGGMSCKQFPSVVMLTNTT